jgi:predicted phage terminase large subunit-like protein
LVGLKGFLTPQNEIIITDMFRDRLSPEQVERGFVNITKQDGRKVIQRIPIDPAGGKLIADRFIRMAKGYPVKALRVINDKETRALPASSMSERGENKIVRADWNGDFFSELEMLPQGSHDDIVDTLSDLVDTLLNVNTARIRTTKATAITIKGY